MIQVWMLVQLVIILVTHVLPPIHIVLVVRPLLFHLELITLDQLTHVLAKMDIMMMVP